MVAQAVKIRETMTSSFESNGIDFKKEAAIILFNITIEKESAGRIKIKLDEAS
jgi:hypothetical protein